MQSLGGLPPSIRSPVLTHDNRSFREGNPLPYRLIVYSVVFVNHCGSSRTSTPTRNFIVHRRGDHRSPVLTHDNSLFREAKRLPYTESYNSAFCILHSALLYPHRPTINFYCSVGTNTTAKQCHPPNVMMLSRGSNDVCSEEQNDVVSYGHK